MELWNPAEKKCFNKPSAHDYSLYLGTEIHNSVFKERISGEKKKARCSDQRDDLMKGSGLQLLSCMRGTLQPARQQPFWLLQLWLPLVINMQSIQSQLLWVSNQLMLILMIATDLTDVQFVLWGLWFWSLVWFSLNNKNILIAVRERSPINFRFVSLLWVFVCGMVFHATPVQKYAKWPKGHNQNTLVYGSITV